MTNLTERRDDTLCASCGRTGMPIVFLEDGNTYCAKCDTHIQVFSPARVRVVGGREGDLRTSD